MEALSQTEVFKSGVCRTISRQTKSWGSVHADLVQRTGLTLEKTDITASRHLILLNLRGTSERGEYLLNSRQAPFVPRKPGSILFIPAGYTWKGWEVGDATAAYLSISVEPTFVATLFDRDPLSAPTSFSPVLGCEDDVMMNAARGIGAEINETYAFSTLLVESCAATIFAQILRNDKYTSTTCKGGLASANLRRVLQRIEDELATDLSLEGLASLAGLSIPHFCRAFRQSLGYPPHTFIIRRRVERAKEYLRHSAMSVTDVALACGFSSSSHLSNAFRRQVGTTPLDYRASWQ
jgi:AraC-like DNA-binding protein